MKLVPKNIRTWRLGLSQCFQPTNYLTNLEVLPNHCRVSDSMQHPLICFAKGRFNNSLYKEHSCHHGLKAIETFEFSLINRTFHRVLHTKHRMSPGQTLQISQVKACSPFYFPAGCMPQLVFFINLFLLSTWIKFRTKKPEKWTTNINEKKEKKGGGPKKPPKCQIYLTMNIKNPTQLDAEK